MLLTLTSLIFLACLCALAKEMGFSEAVVQSYKKVKEFYIFSSQGSALDPSVRDDQFEIPNAVASLMEDTTNGGYVLFTEGTIDLLMACSSDYWDGADIRPLDEAIRKKIHDIHQNAVTNDLQCVLYSYAPVLPSKELTELLSAYAGPIYFELDREPPAKSRTRAFLKELLCGQVFLAMAALAHQPKEVGLRACGDVTRYVLNQSDCAHPL